MPSPAPAESAPRRRPRRGAVLLLVLSLLSLFLMIGTLMVVLATRARSAARAFADGVTGSGFRVLQARQLLDEAFLVALRGRRDGQGPTRESLLSDRYGTNTLRGTLAAAPTGSPILRATVNRINADPATLRGRILTIKPQVVDPAPTSSFRILSGNGTMFELANLRTVSLKAMPTRFPCEVFINGREFSGDAEAWDAFDAGNAFLTELQANGDAATISRCAFAPQPGAPAVVDNDGDGVADGVWLNDVLPPLPDGATARVSYLVLELDGRVNVNAHGTPAANPGSGPASVDISTAIGDPNVSAKLMNGTTSPAAATAPSTAQRRSTPALGGQVDGRFGGGAADTYQQRLDYDGARPASRRSPIGNLFTCGELEWLLRPYDADNASLPPRLAAVLGPASQASRLLATTDSWDTCGITGATAEKVFAAGQANVPKGVSEGLRFNLDRSLADDAAKQQFFDDLVQVVVAAGLPSGQRVNQWVANVVEFLDSDATPGQFQPANGDPPITGFEPPADGTFGTWNRGACEGPGDLLGVPVGTKAEIDDDILNNRPLVSLAATSPEILDAVTVDSPFRTTTFLDAGGQRFCRWREPGRVNVNTCNERVWRAVAGGGTPSPFSKANPARTSSEIVMAVPQVFGLPDRDVRGLDRNLANRLANIGTPRSNVFAIWVTLRAMVPNDPDSVRYHRAFYIVDRSIPVGFEAGSDHNVSDCIRLRRIIE